jgi:RHS repeat-associated protein
MTEEAISRSEAKGTLTYGLDPVGNRQSLASTVTGMNSQTASYNPNDRVTGNSYDANGNTLGAGGKSYAYDSMDRMTSFNGGSVTMVYDGDGNRVKKVSGGVTTQYLVDDLNPTGLPQVMDEVVKSGVAQRTYLYGLRRISQTQVASGTTSYYGYDAHGDARYLMDSTGAVTDTYDYDAFGNLVGSTGTTPNVYRYQGEALDAETGLYYLRARYYDPTVGRFLNVDPMTDEGEHPYEYADADPVNGHDPTGEQDVIEYSLLMWLYTAHVPPPHGYMSCQGGILFSADSGAGSGGGSGMQAADASAAATMSRLGVACQIGGGKGPAGSGSGKDDPKRRVPIAVVATKDYMTRSQYVPGALERDIEYYLYDNKDRQIAPPDATITEHLERISGPKVSSDNGGYPFEDGIASGSDGPFVRKQTFVARVDGVDYPNLPIVSCINDVTRFNRLDASSTRILVNDKRSPDSYRCRR